MRRAENPAGRRVDLWAEALDFLDFLVRFSSRKNEQKVNRSISDENFVKC